MSLDTLKKQGDMPSRGYNQELALRAKMQSQPFMETIFENEDDNFKETAPASKPKKATPNYYDPYDDNYVAAGVGVGIAKGLG